MIARIAKNIMKHVGILVLCLVLAVRPAAADGGLSLLQILTAVVNAVGFILAYLAIDDAAEEVAPPIENVEKADEEAWQGIIDLLAEQNDFEMMDNDDLEQLDAAEFFAQTTADANQIAYMHHIAATFGPMGSMQGGEVLSSPLYGSGAYEFHRQMLLAHFNLRRDDLANQIELQELNNKFPCQNVPGDMTPAEQQQCMANSEQQVP